MKNTVEHVPLLGGESVELTQRDPSCKFALDLTAAQEVTFMTRWKRPRCRRWPDSRHHGGQQVAALAAVRAADQPVTKQDVSGKRMVGFDGTRVPTPSGNDEARLVLF
jgi:hypothetical protein